MNRRHALFSNLVTILLWSFLTSCAFCDEPSGPVPLGDDSIYQVQAGDTLVSLSQKFFATENTTELRRLLGNPRELKEGDLILIPGPIRAQALEQIALANRAIEEAVKAKAEVYAKSELDLARKIALRADGDRMIGEYRRAKVTGQDAIEKANKAKRAALENMLPPRTLDGFRFGGDLLVGTTDGRWGAPGETTQYKEGTRLRTPCRARSKMNFHDGVTVYLDGDSELKLEKIRTSLEENHPGHCVTRLERGSVQVDARMMIPNSIHEVTVDGHRVELKPGSVLRLSRKGARLFFVCTAGTVAFASSPAPGENKVRATLPAGKSAVFSPQDGFKPMMLPPSPTIPPAMLELSSPSQRPDLSWTSPLKEWRVELARDPEFINIVEDVTVATPRWRSLGLVEGGYYWRVTGLSAEGNLGLPTEASLMVKPNLNIVIHLDPEVPDFVAGREVLLTPETRLRVEPLQEGVKPSGYEIRLSGGEWIPWQGAGRAGGLLADPSKNWILFEVRAVGLAGQRGAVLRQPIRIDNAGPTLLLNTKVERDNNRDWVAAVLTAEDPSGVKEVEFSLDGRSTWKPYAGPVRVLLDDSRLLWFRASDKIGNRSRAMNAVVRME